MRAPLILIVDDDSEVRRILRAVLEAADFRVSEASSGLWMVNQLQVSVPAVILLDVMMPWAQGTKLRQALQGNQHFAHIPICLMSGSRTTAADREEAQRDGAAAYFVKPIAWPSLLSTMDQLTGRRGPASSGAAAPPAGRTLGTSAGAPRSASPR